MKKTSEEAGHWDPPLYGKKKERATIAARPALGALDGALSTAQDRCSRLIGSQDPIASRIGNEAFDQIEAIRRRIMKVVVG